LGTAQNTLWHFGAVLARGHSGAFLYRGHFYIKFIFLSMPNYELLTNNKKNKNIASGGFLYNKDDRGKEDNKWRCIKRKSGLLEK
jgi:hypothetical protein